MLRTLGPVLLCALFCCEGLPGQSPPTGPPGGTASPDGAGPRSWRQHDVAAAAPAASPALRLVEAAIARTRKRVRYDGGYRPIPYPGGDVPDGIGVCTDLVIRSYRALGIDLQKAVHEDMSTSFVAYPRIWGLTRPDPNIDHRRVPNLRVFLRRQGAAMDPTRVPSRYRAGDLVTWRLRNGLPHIGIVTNRRSGDGRRPLVAHNIGRGPVVDDALLRFPITGHYRYLPPIPTPAPGEAAAAGGE